MKRWLALAILALGATMVALGAGHAAAFDPQAATDAYLATITPEAKAKSDAYFEGGYWLILVDALYAVGVALILLFTRLSAAMRNIAESFLPWRWLQTAAYAVMFIVVTGALTFPLTMYEGYTREHEFGLSNMTFEAWFNEFLTGQAISVVMGAIALTVIYAIVRAAPRTWWIWGAVAASILMTFAIALQPIYISPLFNDYKPMREGPLKEEILSMARASGVPVDNVYEVDQSRQTKRVSANVQGMFGTARVSLNDNLLLRGTPAEVKAVKGHEIGHYVGGHIFSLIMQLSLLAAVGFAFVQWGFGGLHAMFGKLWRVRDIGDPAGLPIAVLLFSVFGVVATPVQNTIVRTNEIAADIYGLNAAREPDGFATIALKLAEYRKLDPTPWEEFIFYDHPSGRSRIAMAMRWKAENMKSEQSETAPPAETTPAESAPPTTEDAPPAD